MKMNFINDVMNVLFLLPNWLKVRWIRQFNNHYFPFLSLFYRNYYFLIRNYKLKLGIDSFLPSICFSMRNLKASHTSVKIQHHTSHMSCCLKTALSEVPRYVFVSLLKLHLTRATPLIWLNHMAMMCKM